MKIVVEPNSSSNSSMVGMGKQSQIVAAFKALKSMEKRHVPYFFFYYQKNRGGEIASVGFDITFVEHYLNEDKDGVFFSEGSDRV